MTDPQLSSLYLRADHLRPADPCRDGHPGHSDECQAPALHGPDVAVIEREALMAVKAIGNAVNNSTWAEARGHAGGHLAYPQDATPGPQPGTAVMSVRIQGVWYDLTLHPAG